MLNQTDQDEGESVTNWHEPIVEPPQTEKPAKITVTKPPLLAADLQEVADKSEDDISTEFSQKSENLIRQQEEELGANQDQPDFEILPEIELKTRKKPEVDPNLQDPEMANLGENRKTTKYGLRTSPTRNKKYFHTDIVIPEDPIELKHGNTILDTIQKGA